MPPRCSGGDLTRLFHNLYISPSRTFHSSAPILVSQRKVRAQRRKKNNLQFRAEKRSREQFNKPDPILGQETDFTRSLLRPHRLWSETTAPQNTKSGSRIDPNTLQPIVDIETEADLSATEKLDTRKAFSISPKDEKALLKTLPSLVHSSQMDKLHAARPSFSVLNTDGLSRDTESIEAAIQRSKEALTRIATLSNANAKGIMLTNIEKAINEFGRGEHYKDTGSPEVQAAVLTAKIQNLYDHLVAHRKDRHNHRGLRTLVHKRQKILKYLKRESLERYFVTLKKLGLDQRAIESEITLPGRVEATARP